MARVLPIDAAPEQRRVYFYVVDSAFKPSLTEEGKQPEVSLNGARWSSFGVGPLKATGAGHYFADIMVEDLALRPYDTIEARYQGAGVIDAPGETVQIVPGEVKPAAKPRTLFEGIPTSVLVSIAQGLNESKDITKNKTTKVRQLFVDLTYPNLVVDTDHIEQVKEEYDALKESYSAKLDAILKSNDIAAMGNASSVMEEAFYNARLLGLHSTGLDLPLEAHDEHAVQGAIKEELGFFSNFLEQHKADALKMPYEQRLGMYEKTLDGIFHAGQVAGLPKEGVIHWKLGIAEHCHDCPKLAAGGPYTKATLPSVPRSGHTQCLSNCKCTLQFEYQGVGFGTSPQVSMQISEVAGVKPTIAMLNVPAVKSMQETLDHLFKTMAYHRQMIEVTSGDAKTEHIQARRELNTQIIAAQEAAKIKAVPRASTDDILGAVYDAKEAGFAPAFKYPDALKKGVKVRVLEGLSSKPGTVVSVKGSKVTLKNVKGQPFSASLDDSDNDIIWLENPPA